MAAPARSRAAALIQQAHQALQRRDVDGALALLERAQAAAPAEPETFMTRALALRMRGDLSGAVAALDGALALDPYNFLALLSKGAVLEQAAGAKGAAEVYRHALKIAPPDDRLARAARAGRAGPGGGARAGPTPATRTWRRRWPRCGRGSPASG